MCRHAPAYVLPGRRRNLYLNMKPRGVENKDNGGGKVAAVFLFKIPVAVNHTVDVQSPTVYQMSPRQRRAI